MTTPKRNSGTAFTGLSMQSSGLASVGSSPAAAAAPKAAPTKKREDDEFSDGVSEWSAWDFPDKDGDLETMGATDAIPTLPAPLLPLGKFATITERCFVYGHCCRLVESTLAQRAEGGMEWMTDGEYDRFLEAARFQHWGSMENLI
ncbi:uncharacterized protein LY89DRAFT_732750 [Mollisia scopiformis]|uniref:Uncharacterized protein n=1 Tax=Mollisia scopiformis TaxID=149040 RepID=A0A194XE69_MOLSC|nr:uncharacterized protein LY89DRAFT_732750 [Mollisia scopiformis]KUJ18057.1 hypothetical protein LY89DRAFT_732750 [Mollisia scopiformis]